MQPHDRFDLETKSIDRIIGLISDTHLPDRLRALPPAVFDVFAGVDLILHAGDVGELRVLDELSQIAPVVAVHGNDDTPEAEAALPAQQIIATRAGRIVVHHSHYADHEDEMAARRIDPWGPKFDRRAGLVHAADGSIGVSGHTHVPMCVTHDNVLLINPGALGSGNYFMRQIRQTVALLAITVEGTTHVAHVDLAAPDHAYDAGFDEAEGYAATAQNYQAWIVTPELDALLPALWPLFGKTLDAVRPALRRLMFRVQDGEIEAISPAMLHDELRTDPDLPPEILAAFEAHL